MIDWNNGPILAVMLPSQCSRDTLQNFLLDPDQDEAIIKDE